jgi:hypothetical protein
MGQRFKLYDAERLLPQVASALRDAIAIKSKYDEADSEMDSATHRIMMLGGALVDRQQMLALRGRRDACASRLKEAIETVQSYGCLIKDLDIGLVDFPTLYRGQEVYLCWKLGEASIGHWHGIDEGFAGRKAIDQDFLDNHRGDEPN